MLSHVQTLETLATPLPHHRTLPKPQDTGLYVFPNCTNGALMGVEYPLELGREVERLLRRAHEDRQVWCPQHALSANDAAKKLGISRSTLRRWVAKGWIYAWTKWDTDFLGLYIETPGYLFSEMEVEAYRLAKPRAL